jgi:hypothetical protein
VAGAVRRYVRAEPACFVLVAGVYLAYFWRSGYDRFYFDAYAYWELGKRFGLDGAFSLVGFYDPNRGYSYPLFNFLLQNVADALNVGDVTIVRISGALLAATLGVVVAPRLARAIFPGANTGLVRVIAFNAIVFALWRDHFQFPLSDFPTLLVASLGVMGLLRRTTGGYVAAGLCLGLAANMRPAYLPVALVGLLVGALLPIRPGGWRSRAASAALVLVPLIYVALPQVAVNDHHRGSLSPAPPSSREGSVRLLSMGLEAQKQETYVGRPTAYPRPDVRYLDPVMRDAIDEEETLPLESYRDYTRVVLEHPLSTAASYGLHVFNNLDVRYATPYIRNLEDRPLVLPVLQFTLLFVAVTQLVLPEARRRLGDVRWLGMALLASTIVTAIPSPATPRYFLGVHLLAYMLACFSPGLRASLLPRRAARRLGLALAWAVVLGACLTLSAAVQRQIEYPISYPISAAEGSRAGPHAR